MFRFNYILRPRVRLDTEMNNSKDTQLDAKKKKIIKNNSNPEYPNHLAYFVQRTKEIRFSSI